MMRTLDVLFVSFVNPPPPLFPFLVGFETLVQNKSKEGGEPPYSSAAMHLLHPLAGSCDFKKLRDFT